MRLHSTGGPHGTARRLGHTQRLDAGIIGLVSGRGGIPSCSRKHSVYAPNRSRTIRRPIALDCPIVGDRCFFLMGSSLDRCCLFGRGVRRARLFHYLAEFSSNLSPKKGEFHGYDYCCKDSGVDRCCVPDS